LRSDIHFSPSPEVARDGWLAFVLEPGSYYLRLTSQIEGRREIIRPIREFRFIVPFDTPLLYIGSLHLTCSTKESTGWFGGRVMGSCSSEPTAANDTEAATAVARSVFADFGSPLSMIMQPYGVPLAPSTILKLAPVGLAGPDRKIDLGSPEWMSRALAMGLAPSAVLGAVGPGKVFFALLWAPAGAAFGYLGGKWSESSWDPCRQMLQESLTPFDPIGVLFAKLKATLDRASVQSLVLSAKPEPRADEAGKDVKSVLSVRLQRIVLHLCPASFLAKTLCLEVATRVQFLDTETKTYLQDRVFVYSNGKPSTPEIRPYALAVTDSEIAGNDAPADASAGRDLEEYCRENGSELLHKDLSRALDAMVTHILRDLGLNFE
jgi:hypothetical protein